MKGKQNLIIKPTGITNNRFTMWNWKKAVIVQKGFFFRLDNFAVSRLVISSIFAFASLILFLCSSCNKNNSSNSTTVSTAVPYVAVNISININNSIYTGLTPTGGVAYISGGYRGILLYRLNAGTIIALDRTCTYDISDAGGVVSAQNNGTAVCPDCGSVYNLNNGSVATGPSTIGLTMYSTNFNQSTGALTIKN